MIDLILLIIGAVWFATAIALRWPVAILPPPPVWDEKNGRFR